MNYAILVDGQDYGGKTYIYQGQYYPTYGGGDNTFPVKIYAGRGRAANASWRLERKIGPRCTVVEYNEGVK
jgi:hypothetical protein